MIADQRDVHAEVPRTPKSAKNGAFGPGCPASTCERSIVPL